MTEDFAGAACEYADHMTVAFDEWWTWAEPKGRYRREEYAYYRELLSARAMAELTSALQKAAS